MSTLRDWFTAASREGSSSSSSNNNTITATNVLPRILLLDGGVSTHLVDDLGASFCHRELWSSSLLMLPNDSNDDESSKQQQQQKNHSLIRQGHLDWLAAGANVISTVTYQLHYESKYWPSRAAPAIIMTDAIMDQMWLNGLSLARQALDQYNCSSSCQEEQQQQQQRPHFVVASSGCYGAAMANGAEYTGKYNINSNDNQQDEQEQCTTTTQHADLVRFHQRKLQTILSSIILSTAEQQGEHQPVVVDGIAIETIPSLAECYALREVFMMMRMNHQTNNNDKDNTKMLVVGGSDNPATTAAAAASSSSCCFIISLACRDEGHLNDGTPLMTALDVLLDIPDDDLVHAVGLNCCHAAHLSGLLDILVPALAARRRQQQQRRGIVIYPNSGEVYNGELQMWKEGTGCRNDSDSWAERLMECVVQIENLWRQHSCSADDDNDNNCSSLLLPSILIGGCCRTTPEMIAALRRAIDKHLLLESSSA